MIDIETFDSIDMRVGTVVSVSTNKRARKPAYKVDIDFGKDIGIKSTSAQITDLYTPETLVGIPSIIKESIMSTSSNIRSKDILVFPE